MPTKALTLTATHLAGVQSIADGCGWLVSLICIAISISKGRSFVVRPHFELRLPSSHRWHKDYSWQHWSGCHECSTPVSVAQVERIEILNDPSRGVLQQAWLSIISAVQMMGVERNECPCSRITFSRPVPPTHTHTYTWNTRFGKMRLKCKWNMK